MKTLDIQTLPDHDVFNSNSPPGYTFKALCDNPGCEGPKEAEQHVPRPSLCPGCGFGLFWERLRRAVACSGVSEQSERVGQSPAAVDTAPNE